MVSCERATPGKVKSTERAHAKTRVCERAHAKKVLYEKKYCRGGVSCVVSVRARKKKAIVRYVEVAHWSSIGGVICILRAGAST